MTACLSDELYKIAGEKKFDRFVDVLYAIQGCINTRQLDILIKIDFFSDFGNQRELLVITELGWFAVCMRDGGL